MDTILKVLTGETFIQGLLLLLITAGLTGLLVPYIKGRIDDKKYRQQKLFEAQLARQSKVIEAQVTLLENLSQLLWEFQYAALKVSYYGHGSNRERYENALKEYDAQSWGLMTKIGTEIGKAQRLVSDNSYRALKDFYYNWMVDIDNRISTLEYRKAALSDWKNHHDFVYIEGARKIEDVLAQLAKELRLEGQQSEITSARLQAGDQRRLSAPVAETNESPKP